MRDKMVLVLEIDGKGQLSPVLSVQLDKTVPKGVAFADNSNDIYVFGLFEGDVYVLRNMSFLLLIRVDNRHRLRGRDGKVLSTHNIGTPIGDVAIDPRRNQFVVDNATDGFSLFQLPDALFVRGFSTGTPVNRRPKQVAYGEGRRVVVGGSDHGAAYVFDAKTGSVLDVLRHTGRDLVQTITVSCLR
jgi:hypothetical protein